MKELHKTIAFNFAAALNGAQTFERKHFVGIKFDDLASRLKLYLDNFDDFRTVLFALKNSGTGYHATAPADYVMVIRDALLNPAILKSLSRTIEHDLRAKTKKFGSVKKKLLQKTFVYLMRHSRNGFCKIGHSQTPQLRERTLQSEDPEIGLLRTWSGVQADELFLHDYFSKFRIRGEWFRLDAFQIEVLCKMMDERSAS